MSSTKEFRIQNGVDITGDVVVGGQIVIQSDGTILLPSSDTLASMITQATSNQVDALQLQIDTILGSSPEHLNTLQEIVALFQSADGDLGTLINQNSTAISSFQTELDLKATPSDLTALTTTVDAFKASVSGVPSTTVPIETLETTTTNVVGAINDLHAGISSLSGGTCIDYNASTGVISVDEADAAANLHVATSGDATTLEGQTVSHYRQDVYDIHGNIIN
jgi:hypothetical protein|tara:strand:+ start:1127 stop:1792 length:666 start_codon:yes stop_codon:yes gene_type:complete